MSREISFNEYYELVVSTLIGCGLKVDDETGWPDEEEVAKDYEAGKGVIECANEFKKNWNNGEQNKT